MLYLYYTQHLPIHIENLSLHRCVQYHVIRTYTDLQCIPLFHHLCCIGLCVTNFQLYKMLVLTSLIKSDPLKPLQHIQLCSLYLCIKAFLLLILQRSDELKTASNSIEHTKSHWSHALWRIAGGGQCSACLSYIQYMPWNKHIGYYPFY